ncbi:MAG TPA: hypothetical protein PKC83_04330 [Gemmatimonadaceae bacterium]|nr:hypothetical protein [Gemmatimonadaceae bacterium]
MTSPRDENLQSTLLSLNARAWGIAFGLVLGGGLFLATLVLVVKGGPTPGPHLQLLGAFFPGYRVSVLGSLVGFVYAFVVGYALGRVIGEVYNRLALR